VRIIRNSQFWLAWEWKWWGGADAVSAIILFLLWPDPRLLVVFTGIHILVLCVSKILSSKTKIYIPGHLPGLPILLGTGVVFQMWLLWNIR
jgi:hypothetical protein